MSRKRNPFISDARTRAAKQQGYPARSVFKLDEIDARVHLLAPGQRVLDLGAAPGSWSLYASQKVGPQGLVVAIDLQPIAQRFAENVRVLRGDARDLQQEVSRKYGCFDVVLSDMAPKTSGNKVQDQVRSFELFMSALGLARQLGSPESHFVGKLFMGPDFEQAKRGLAEAYARQRVIRPRGTRQQSSELFLVGQHKRAAPPAVPTSAERS